MERLTGTKAGTRESTACLYFQKLWKEGEAQEPTEALVLH